MVTKKDRRHNGYVSPQATISYKELIKNDLFILPFYSDWDDYRDGQRDWMRDFKKIKNVKDQWEHHFFEKRMQMNRKQEKLLRRRKAKKVMRCLRESGIVFSIELH